LSYAQLLGAGRRGDKASLLSSLIFMNLLGLLNPIPLLYHYILTIVSLYLITMVKLRHGHRLLLKPPTKNSLGPDSRSVLTIVA